MPGSRSCCRVCCRGLYSCRWSQTGPGARSRSSCCWFSVVSLVSLLSVCWIYVCLITYNDREDINWKGFMVLKLWVNWFLVLTVVSAVVSSYCVLLLLFALFQVALGEQPDLHWLHKVFLFFGVFFISAGVAGISIKWKEEWPIVPLSFQVTGPFLQFGAVGALTLLSPFVFQSFHKSKNAGSKGVLVSACVFVYGLIYLCPLFIHSSCLTSELPPKPQLIGHRGAPMLAPENTMMSFRRSVRCNVTAFETDVQLSKDRVPFLMHDSSSEFLLRTTDVKQKFPERSFTHSENLTWEELQTLNAGQWFLKTDPFHSVWSLSEQEQSEAANQTVASLEQLLVLAQENNISVMFDLYSPNQWDDTNDTVGAILDSGVHHGLIRWLPPVARSLVNTAAPGFIQVYANETEMEEKGGNHLNVKYSKYSTKELRELREKNVDVNVWVVNERWLFSVLWCAGVSSVTTNSCHLLQDMETPVWFMAPHTYLMVWILVDVASCLMVLGLYLYQRRAHLLCHRTEKQRDRTSTWNDKELSPFLATG